MRKSTGKGYKTVNKKGKEEGWIRTRLNERGKQDEGVAEEGIREST